MSGNRVFLNAYKVGFIKMEHIRPKKVKPDESADVEETDVESSDLGEEAGELIVKSQEEDAGDEEEKEFREFNYISIQEKIIVNHKTFDSEKNKLNYEEVELSLVDILNEYMTNHCAEYKDLNDEVLIKKPTKKPEPVRAFKFEKTDKQSQTIYGVVKLGTSGYPIEIIEPLSKVAGRKTTTRLSATKNDSSILDYSFFLDLKSGEDFGYLIMQEIGSKSAISVFKKSINNYLRIQGLMFKAIITPVFVKTREGFIPEVTNINVEVFEKQSKSAQSRSGSTAKKATPQTFKGVMNLPYGFFSWNDFVSAESKTEYVEKKLKHFYSFTQLDTSLEKRMKLTIRIGGVTRTLLVRELLEFSMGIDVTDKLKMEDDGRAQKASFIKEAKDVIEFIKKA